MSFHVEQSERESGEVSIDAFDDDFKTFTKIRGSEKDCAKHKFSGLVFNACNSNMARVLFMQVDYAVLIARPDVASVYCPHVMRPAGEL
jgi:hypothetical protein